MSQYSEGRSFFQLARLEGTLRTRRAEPLPAVQPQDTRIPCAPGAGVEQHCPGHPARRPACL